MGGHQVTGRGPVDDGYDEDGYDESQRAEILEATRDGPSDGTILTDLNPDMGEDLDAPEEEDEIDLDSEEVGVELISDGDEDDDDEDDVQADFDRNAVSDDALDDGDAAALNP